jgi:nicotinamidase-related amidase
MLELSAPTTALLLVDLQKGIVPMPMLAPRSGAEVAVAGGKLAKSFRAAGATVILINVDFAPDFGDALKAPVDRETARSGGLPPNFSELVDDLAQPSDIRVTKHQWGAFYGTDLDLQLRRRGIKAVVLGGIATNFGVESTARQAHEAGYQVVIAEDAMTSLSSEMHAFAVNVIFPMLSRVVKAADIHITR